MTVVVPGASGPAASSDPEPAAATRPGSSDWDTVVRLLGREPKSSFAVGLRRHDGSPVVLVNEPILGTGEPMPTRYWLCDPFLVKVVSRLESAGGVNRAEAEIDPDELRAAHGRYAAERDRRIAADHTGPRPSGGVGGTRIGVKCLHAHLANHLMGADDPVGRWVADHLDAAGEGFDPTRPGLVTARHSWPATGPGTAR